MAEVHIIGEIVSAQGFPDAQLFCKWGLHYVLGGGWKLVGGLKEGQTQTDLPEIEDVAFFSHPLDIHLSTRTIQGWPKLHLQVWHQDGFGRQEIYGYGFCHVPTSPGDHVINCATWRPIGTFREEVLQRFVGGGPQLRNSDTVFNSTDRYKLNTIAMGSVALRLGVLLRNFDKFGIEGNFVNLVKLYEQFATSSLCQNSLKS